MSTVFSPCDSPEQLLCAELISKYHPDLSEAGVKVDLIFAYSETGNAVKLNGYPCQAVARIIGLKERTKGMGDCEILIDLENWKALGVREKGALMDHELFHFAVKRDQHDNTIKTDDQNRPKLAMRKHDQQFGWFNVIAARWKKASAEVKQAIVFADKWGQYYFPGLGIGDIDDATRGIVPKDLIDTGKSNIVQIPGTEEDEEKETHGHGRGRRAAAH